MMSAVSCMWMNQVQGSRAVWRQPGQVSWWFDTLAASLLTARQASRLSWRPTRPLDMGPLDMVMSACPPQLGVQHEQPEHDLECMADPTGPASNSCSSHPI
jgi:hypothetical protein